LSRFTATGAVETALLFLAVWWVWVFTAWITNWLDPEQTAVRILLFLLMLAGLVLSTSIPHAFEARGLWFGAAYAAMQVGRTSFFVAAAPPSRPAVRRNGIRILAWLSASAVFWILGGLAEGERRLWLWGLALAIEYASPLTRFWIPAYGASTIQDWYVEGSHMAERCAGFILIALGESIVVTGATFAELNWTATTAAAFASAFIASIAMWWIYFHKGAEAGSEKISKSAESGRVARSAYTYLHMPIVAGIILSAVADDLVLAHPDGHSDPKTIACAIGGPLLFLVGTILFKHNIRGFLQLSHGVGIVALGVLAFSASGMSPLALSLLTSVALVVVAVWESVSLRSKA
jgi:low temperature requirement protein LtrA